MGKFFSFLLMGGGVILIAFSAWQIWQSNLLQEQALVEARVGLETVDEEYDPNDFTAEIGDTIGILQIPALDRELPIVYGVDEDELMRGVGHYPGTAFPGQLDQVVLSGHRDTVFTKLGELEIGDSFIVEMPYGDYEYIIQDTEIVDADDRTVIRSTSPDEVLTVITCYPFNFVGNAPERYIIYATPKE
ncbi:class D sortase [Alkalihalobacillus sp. LMS39]|uniref:class D sortase n=1 Tax=Alkalihalobacillus sp. LMS39 TaxID=2924032 RepID=UPI001FB21151|nr:class D sortase [Alkalihalobacillus sp. LMS39]UOE93907.1 class D sortase [Alkalihalobacillus sp. LMS39]